MKDSVVFVNWNAFEETVELTETEHQKTVDVRDNANFTAKVRVEGGKTFPDAVITGCVPRTTTPPKTDVSDFVADASSGGANMWWLTAGLFGFSMMLLALSRRAPRLANES